MKNTKRRWLVAITCLLLMCVFVPANAFEVFAADTSNSEEIAERVDIEDILDDEEIASRTVRATSEDYRAWAQADSRWGSISLGGTSYTMKSSGCLVTAITKLIVQSELKSSSSFTPKTLVTWLNNNGGFTSSAALYWAKPAEYVSGLSYYGNLLNYSTYTSSKYNSQFISWINSGYHMVVQVKSGGHWVAIDELKTLESGEVYIMDSQPTGSNADVTLASKYSTFNRVVAYKGGTTPEVLDEIPTLSVQCNSDSETDVSLLIEWTKAKDYTAAYNIERSLSVDGEWEVVQEITDGSVTEWVDENVEPETTYFYRVQPLNEEGEGGPYSDVVEFTTKHVHSYKKTVYKKATTSEKGKIKNTCTSCGYVKYTTIYAIDSVTLSAAKLTYNGNVRKPAVIVKNTAGKQISSSYYTVTYASGRKNVGKYKVTVTFSGRYSGTVTKYFTIIPQKTSISKATGGSKYFNLYWTKISSQVSGYEVKYSTSSSFSYNCAVKTYSYSKASAKISTYYGGRYYYAKIRTYKTVNGTKYYSGWSAAKKVWIK